MEACHRSARETLAYTRAHRRPDIESASIHLNGIAIAFGPSSCLGANRDGHRPPSDALWRSLISCLPPDTLPAPSEDHPLSRAIYLSARGEDRRCTLAQVETLLRRVSRNYPPPPPDLSRSAALTCSRDRRPNLVGMPEESCRVVLVLRAQSSSQLFDHSGASAN